MMKYPTLEEVQKADKELICLWWRDLPSPANDEQKTVIDKIAIKFLQCTPNRS